MSTIIRKWLSTPITWGSYFRFGGILSLITTIWCVLWYIKIGLLANPLDWIHEKLNKDKED